MKGIQRWPTDSLPKRTVMQKSFHAMTSSRNMYIRQLPCFPYLEFNPRGIILNHLAHVLLCILIAVEHLCVGVFLIAFGNSCSITFYFICHENDLICQKNMCPKHDLLFTQSRSSNFGQDHRHVIVPSRVRWVNPTHKYYIYVYWINSFYPGWHNNASVILINIGPIKGLLPDGTKHLLATTLTNSQ